MTISYSELRRGTVIELEEEPWQVLDWKHTKMQQRAPVLTLKLRGLRNGRTIERNVPGNQKLTLAEVDTRESQYLYSDGDLYYFMDTRTFDQHPLGTDKLGDALLYIKEQDMVELVFYRGDPISLELPNLRGAARGRHPARGQGQHSTGKHQAGQAGDGAGRAGALLRQRGRGGEGGHSLRGVPRKGGLRCPSTPSAR